MITRQFLRQEVGGGNGDIRAGHVGRRVGYDDAISRGVGRRQAGEHEFGLVRARDRVGSFVPLIGEVWPGRFNFERERDARQVRAASGLDGDHGRRAGEQGCVMGLDVGLRERIGMKRDFVQRAGKAFSGDVSRGGSELSRRWIAAEVLGNRPRQRSVPVVVNHPGIEHHAA